MSYQTLETAKRWTPKCPVCKNPTETERHACRSCRGIPAYEPEGPRAVAFWHHVLVHEITRADRAAEKRALKQGRFFNTHALPLMLGAAQDAADAATDALSWRTAVLHRFNPERVRDKVLDWFDAWLRSGEIPKAHTGAAREILSDAKP